MFTELPYDALKTKQGFDKMEIILIFFGVLCGTFDKKINESFEALKPKISTLIGRDLLQIEYNKMLVGITDFVMSEPGTNERTIAMNYLFELEFLNSSENAK